MQSNNRFLVFSSGSQNIFTASDIESSQTVQTSISNGPAQGTTADSQLYNTLSKATSLVCTAIIDLVANQFPSETYSVDTSLEALITAIQDTFVTTNELSDARTALQNNIDSVNSSTNTRIDNIVNGGTTVAKAENVTGQIDGKNITDIFEINGTTAKLSTNANYLLSISPSDGQPPAGSIGVCEIPQLPQTTYQNMIYIISSN